MTYTPIDWADAARQQSVEPYLVFRGSFPSGAQVRWGTRGAHHPNGFIEPRLMEIPPSVMRGIPESVGSMPERVSASLRVDNRDGALDAIWIGGLDVDSEYSGDSFRNLSGKLYVGLVGPGGFIAEEAVTPTLVLAGDPQSASGEISLALGSLDDTILGPASKLATAEEVVRGQVLARDTQQTQDMLQELPQLLPQIETLDEVVPYAYGACSVPLIYLARTSTHHVTVAFASLQEPRISSGWMLSVAGSREKHPAAGKMFGSSVWKAKLRLLLAGEQVDLWVVGTRHTGAIRKGVRTAHDETIKETIESLWLTPAPASKVGLSAITTPSPAMLARQIVWDLSLAGIAGIDQPSFNRANTGAGGYVGGTIKSNAPLREILSHFSAFGLAFHITTDDLLACVRGGWGAYERELALTDLPELRPEDILAGTWEETLPVSPEARGAASTRVSIDWTQEQRDAWPIETRTSGAPGASRELIGQESEVRLPGAWIYPPRRDGALAIAASRRDVSGRRVRVGTMSLWPAALPIGQLVRVSHPFGIADASGGRYERRLMRVERVEINAKDAACRLTLEDLGRFERLRTGMLDSMIHWVNKRATDEPTTLRGTVGSELVETDAPFFSESMRGCSLWIPAAPDERDRARKIGAFISPKQVQLIGETQASFALNASNFTVDGILDEPWLVMLNHAHDRFDFRGEYIRAAAEVDGTFSEEAAEAETGFRLLL